MDTKPIVAHRFAVVRHHPKVPTLLAFCNVGVEELRATELVELSAEERQIALEEAGFAVEQLADGAMNVRLKKVIEVRETG